MPIETAKEFAERILAAQKKFSEEIYPVMSREEKIQHWHTSTYNSMRAQGEGGGDEYDAFDKGWYEEAKQEEPDFDAIFKEAAGGLFQFDWAEYKRRISRYDD